MKIGDATAYEEARKIAKEKLRADFEVVERKFLLGTENIFTIAVVADPSCKGCKGRGSQYTNGVGWVCHCVTTGKIIEDEAKQVSE